MSQPYLETTRLILRPLCLADAPAIQKLAGDRDIASTTLTIPHPYLDGMAEEWINSLQSKDNIKAFALVLLPDTFIGGMGLHIDSRHLHAELGYWIGKPYWGKGYATEAAHAILKYGFEVLNLNRIHAAYFSRNPASARVLQKIGMRYEGYLRQHVKKWEAFEDLELYGILKSDYLENKSTIP